MPPPSGTQWIASGQCSERPSASRIEDPRHHVLARAGLGQRLADGPLDLARVLARALLSDVAHEAVDQPALADPDRRRRQLDPEPTPVPVQRGQLEPACRGVLLAARQDPLVGDAIAGSPALGDQELVDALAHDLFLVVAEQR